MSEHKKKPVYSTFPSHSLEEVEYLTNHGMYKEGDKSKVHPNTAILLRFKGIVKDKSFVKKSNKLNNSKANK